MKHLEEFLNQLQQYHYTKLLLFIVELTAVLYGAIFFEKLKGILIFFWYLLFDFSLFLTSITLDSFSVFEISQMHLINQIINTAISITEVVVYYKYFGINLKKNKILKTYIYLIISLIALFKIFGYITKDIAFVSFFSESHLISSWSFLIIFPIAILNILRLIKDNSVDNLSNNPDFWITLGILYYSAVSTPYYYFRGYFDLQHESKVVLDSILFYTPFTINIICILIAFICKKQARN